MRESNIEKRLVMAVKRIGGLIRKVEWVSVRGAPDRFVCLPERGCFWVELKAPGKKPDPRQVREHETLRKFGQSVEVIDSIEQIDKLIK